MATQVHTEIRPVTPPIPFPASIEQRPKPAATPKKKLIRRTDRDRSQITRRGFQAAFLLLNLWIGGIFYFWVRQFEPGGTPTSLQRPAGVEGWLPIAGLMNLRYFILTHHVPTLHPAGMFLLISFLAMSFLFRKAFCSWLCPVGTISEYLWRAGQKLFRRNFFLPRWLDIPLRGLKYLLLGFFAWAVTSMAADELAAFMNSPYGVIADVKMLNFFRHLGHRGQIATRAAFATGIRAPLASPDVRCANVIGIRRIVIGIFGIRVVGRNSVGDRVGDRDRNIGRFAHADRERVVIPVPAVTTRRLAIEDLPIRELAIKEQCWIRVRRHEEVGTAISKSRPAVAVTVWPERCYAGPDTGIGVVAPAETERSDRGRDSVNLSLNGQTGNDGKCQQEAKQETGSPSGQHRKPPPRTGYPIGALLL